MNCETMMLIIVKTNFHINKFQSWPNLGVSEGILPAGLNNLNGKNLCLNCSLSLMPMFMDCVPHVPT